MNIAVLGAPGCGKGTQAKLLAPQFGLKHFSLGETLRMEVDKGTELGRKTQTYVSKGVLVPEPIVLEVFESFVTRNANRELILDGYPRTMVQAEALDTLLNLSSVILFQVAEEEILARVSGRVVGSKGRSYNLQSNPPPTGVQYKRRDDDRPEVVQERFREYCRDIVPIAHHYRQQGILLNVNATGSIGSVLDQLLGILREASESTK